MATYQARVLVIANQTAGSPELVAALQARQQKGPDGPDATDAGRPQRLRRQGGDARAARRACSRSWREAGFDAEGVVGDPDPAVAVQETWDPRNFDEVIVSTLPGSTSKWLQSDLPHRVAADHRLRRPARRGRQEARAELRPAARQARPRRARAVQAARAEGPLSRSASARGSRPGRQLAHARLVRREPQADDPRLGDLVRAQPAAELRPRARRAARRRCGRRARPGPPAARPSRRRGRRRSRTRRGAPRRVGCGASTSREPAWIARITPPSRSSSVRSRAWRRRSQAARSKRCSGAAARIWPSMWASSDAPPSCAPGTAPSAASRRSR